MQEPVFEEKIEEPVFTHVCEENGVLYCASSTSEGVYCYTYVLNNPLRFTDPSGYSSEDFYSAEALNDYNPQSDYYYDYINGGGAGTGDYNPYYRELGNSRYAIDASNGVYRDPLTMKTHKVEYDYVRGKYYHLNQTGSSTFWIDGEIYVKPLWGQNTYLGNFVTDASVNADKLLPPVDLKYPITSPYTESNRNIPELKQNRPHRAIDIGTPVGTYIVSPWSGTIVMANPTDYGLAVIIRHDYTYNGDFIQTGYAHLSDMFVTQGMEIQRGDSIGLTGTYGTGPHLHFTLRSGNRKVDPTLLFPYK